MYLNADDLSSSGFVPLSAKQLQADTHTTDYGYEIQTPDVMDIDANPVIRMEMTDRAVVGTNDTIRTMQAPAPATSASVSNKSTDANYTSTAFWLLVLIATAVYFSEKKA